MPRKSRRQETTENLRTEKKVQYLGGAYLRISVKKKNDTIENQKEMIDDYLLMHREIELVRYYIDDGKSGSNFDRQSFGQLMEDVRNKKVNCIIVKDLSRFSRDHIELGEYVFKILPFLGVRFISLLEHYDSSDPKCDRQFLLVAFKSLMNDYYAKDISVKVSSLKRVKRLQGLHTGAFAPYGYTYDSQRNLMIDESSAEIVKRIFYEVLQGKGLTAIAHGLSEDDIPVPAFYNFNKGIFHANKYENNTNWYPSTIKAICNNLVYLGDMVQNKTKASLAFHISYKKLPVKDWVFVQGTHPPIVERDTFFAVQRILDDRAKQYTQTLRPDLIRRENLYHGIIVCGDCGRKMKRIKNTGSGSKRARYRFVCPNYLLNRKSCTKKTFPELLLNEIIYETLKKYINLAVKLEELYSWLQDHPKLHWREEETKRNIDKKNKKILLYQKMIRETYEDYVKQRISVSDFQSLRSKYENNITLLQEEITKDNHFLKALEKENLLNNKWFQSFFQFQNKQELDAGMLHALIRKIEVFDEYSLRITFCFSDELKVLFENMNLIGEVIS